MIRVSGFHSRGSGDEPWKNHIPITLPCKIIAFAKTGIESTLLALANPEHGSMLMVGCGYAILLRDGDAGDN